MGDLLRAYYRHVAPEDVVERSPRGPVRRAGLAPRARAESRPQGTAAVRVVTPDLADAGWSAAGHSVVEVVTDDMPFLVDSVTMELARLEHNVHVVIHPQFEVDPRHHRRAAAASRADRGAGVGRRTPPTPCDESWMHVEIDRVDDDGGRRRSSRSAPARAARRPRVGRGLGQDARPGAGHGRRARPRPAAAADATRCAQGASFLRWLADDHFTFLGYREYQLEPRRTARSARCARCPAPGSASCAPTRTCRRRSASCPPLVQGEGPREDAARAGQGQLARHRAPPGVPRLRRRQDVRRGRRGRRRAPLPRPVLQRRLHRVGRPGSRCCARRSPR